ncbi:hypothetical protein [Gordonia sputi]|uniref:hypothetical protein n=1 Tax=Gordonia sputi TaxID=36823 RepID=UPI0036772781
MAASRRRVSGRRRLVRRLATRPARLGFAGLLVLAVVVMHGLVGPTHAELPAAPPMHAGMQMGPSTGADSHMSSGDHCAVLGHHCLSLRAIDFPTIEPAVVGVLVFAALLLALATVWMPAVRRLGRPPPWAIRDHLCLNVIRC